MESVATNANILDFYVNIRYDARRANVGLCRYLGVDGAKLFNIEDISEVEVVGLDTS